MVSYKLALVFVVAVVTTFVASQAPTSTCCGILREHQHIGRYCGLDRDLVTCGYTYNTMCHEWNDHGTHPNTPTKMDAAAESLIKADKGCHEAFMRWQCSQACVQCVKVENVWEYRGACASLCDEMLTACPTLFSSPLYGSIWRCNSTNFSTDEETCNVVDSWDNTQNALGWGLMSASVFCAAAFLIAAFVFEWVYVPYKLRKDEMNAQFEGTKTTTGH